MEKEINKQVLETFCKVSLDFVGNSNSLHELGLNSKKLEIAATKQISDIFKFSSHDVIYTGGRVEANNLAILGIFQKNSSLNKKIVVFDNCSKSIFDVCDNIKNKVIIVKTYEDFLSVLDEDVLMVCFKDYEIGKLIKKNCLKFNFFLLYDCCDIVCNCSEFDFISLDLKGISPLVGIGILAKKKNIIINPLIHGGKSTTVYRSGTPALALIVAFSKNLRLLYSFLKKGQNING